MNCGPETEKEMLTVHDYERIRQAYYVEKKSIRQIGRETGHGYWTVRKALENSAPQPYHAECGQGGAQTGVVQGTDRGAAGRERTAAAQTALYERQDLSDNSAGRVSRCRIDGALLREPAAQGVAAPASLPAAGL